MNDLMAKFTEFLKKGNNIKIVVFLGLAGMGLILVSSILGDNDKSNSESTENNTLTNVTLAENNADYSIKLEDSLKGLLETIDGVGKTEIMVTISESEEYVYAQEEKVNNNYTDSTNNHQEENQYVIIENSGTKQPILKKTLSPQVSGVVIVCEGGDSNIVCENIYKTVSVALGIPSNKIYVTKLK